jgi:hypothetical protein
MSGLLDSACISSHQFSATPVVKRTKAARSGIGSTIVNV